MLFRSRRGDKSDWRLAMSSKAHCDSFPLFYLMGKLQDCSSEEAASVMNKAILDLGLQDDLKVTVCGTGVRLSNETEYGSEVIEELTNRAYEEEQCKRCDYGSFGTCKRCGHTMVS